MSGSNNHLRRKKAVVCCVCILSAAAMLFAADSVADAITARLRAQLTADVSEMRGIACMESVERTRYEPRLPNRNATCGELIAAANGGAPRGAREWHSRLRLDVTAGADAENFALTDVRALEHNDVGGMLRAADAGSGEFSSFLRNLINADNATLQSRGPLQTAAGALQAFGFIVPAEKSHFVYTSADPSQASATVRTGYSGSLFTLSQFGDLKQLTLEAENAGDACRIQYTTDYSATRVGDREVILPQSSTMDVVYRNGTELRSETYYSGCRRPGANGVAASTAVPSAASTTKPLLSGVKFKVRFQPPIDTETAATGDPVVGVIRTTVKDKQNGVVVHAGDRIHGRIALIEQYLLPHPQWNLAIAIETIERGVGDHGIDQGVEQPVSLIPLDDGDREPHDDGLTADKMQQLRPPSGGYLVFHDPSVLLDPKFETEWQIR